MTYRFKKHYTRDEARKLLPHIRKWLAEGRLIQEQISKNDQRIQNLVTSGNDVGGESINSNLWLHLQMQELLKKFSDREIFIKDLERGLLDFPAIVQGREVFLCWEEDEEDIEFWHDIESGYAGREPIE